MPHTGSGAVMGPDSFVDFGNIYIVCLFTYLTSLLSSFLILSFLLICFLTHFLRDLFVFFQNRPILFPGLSRRRRPNVALVFRSTVWVDLIKWVSSVCSSVRTYVCPSVHRFQWNNFRAPIHVWLSPNFVTSSVIPLATGDEVIKFWKVKVSGGGMCSAERRFSLLWMHVCLWCVWFSFSVVSQEIGWEEHLQNDLFCVGCDVKP